MQTLSHDQIFAAQEAAASVTDDGRSLRLGLPSGEVVCLDAATAWTHCPSALRRRQRLDGRSPAAPTDIRIVRLTLMGNYAINIAFSDGHDSGVYPWALLIRLASMPKLADFLIPAPDAAPILHTAL